MKAMVFLVSSPKCMMTAVCFASALLLNVVVRAADAGEEIITWTAGFGGAEFRSTTVAAGTTLIFEWNGEHNVHIMGSKTAYDNCDFTSAENIGESSPVEYTITEPTYFACSVATHCPGGQKLDASVTNSDGEVLTNPSECFSAATSFVQVEDKGTLRMDRLEVGKDRVLTKSGTFQTVYAFDHQELSKRTTFLQIVVKNDTEEEENNGALLPPLEVTPSHMVFLEGHANPVPAATLQVGDAMQTNTGPRQIKQVSSIMRTGVLSPLTNDGTIVVNGIIASTFSAHFNHKSEYMMVAGVGVTAQTSHTMRISHQSFFEKLTTPYKIFCNSVVSFGMCHITTDKKKVAMSAVAGKLLEYYRMMPQQQQQNKMVPTIILSMMIGCVYTIEWMLMSYKFVLLAALLFCCMKGGNTTVLRKHQKEFAPKN